eukprot:TRINITY_DN8810_c0_g1_i1.p1 TRINITY_DN8810_c0_g1~~TRINITY_DN8810_c0_g1_i1.p1  ORF type:complete len:409 (+),score=74.99 TRINITY_DN8810_c0_g1_i1:132-1229(+)
MSVAQEKPFALNHYRLLGASGLRVSPFCLGTMTFGDKWAGMGMATSKEETWKILDLYIGAGGNFIDTANVYQFGQSEEWIGEYLEEKGNRNDVVLATKYSSKPSMKAAVNSAGNNRKSLFENVDASLKRLRTDYIDLYYVHYWDFTTPVEEVMRSLNDLVCSGKIHYIGISDTPAWVVAQANTLAAKNGWPQFIAYQGRYSLVDRDQDRDILPMARTLNLGGVPWGVIGGGKLTGKYKRNETVPPEGAERHKYGAFKVSEREHDVADVVVAIAEELGRSPSQVAVNWMLTQPGVASPLIGCRMLRHLEDNLKALEFKLTEEQLKRLDEISKIPDLGFPHNFIGQSIETSPWLTYGDTTGMKIIRQ